MFRKKTKEQQIDFRKKQVFHLLTSDSDFTFTELETVQILNDVKLKLGEHLLKKKNDCLQKSKALEEKAEEINNALLAIE